MNLLGLPGEASRGVLRVSRPGIRPGCLTPGLNRYGCLMFCFISLNGLDRIVEAMIGYTPGRSGSSAAG